MAKDTPKSTPTRRSQKATPFSPHHFEDMEQLLARTKRGKNAKKVVSTRRSGLGTLFSSRHFEEMDQQLAKVKPGKKVMLKAESEEEGATPRRKIQRKNQRKPAAHTLPEAEIPRGRKRGRGVAETVEKEEESEEDLEYLTAPSSPQQEEREPKRQRTTSDSPEVDDEETRGEGPKEKLGEKEVEDEESDQTIDVEEEFKKEELKKKKIEDDKNEASMDEEEGLGDERFEKEEFGEEEVEDEESDQTMAEESEGSLNEEDDEGKQTVDENKKVEDKEEGNVSEDGEDEDVEEISRNGSSLRYKPETNDSMGYKGERGVEVEYKNPPRQQIRCDPTVTPAPKGFMNYLTSENTIGIRPIYKFGDLSKNLVLKIFELLHDEDDPKAISSICFGLTCKGNWAWFQQRWCIPVSKYSIYKGYLPKEDQALLAPLLQNWVPDTYRIMSGVDGNGGASFVPMFLSRREYGEGYTREEERLEKRYEACVSILDAEKQDYVQVIFNHGLRTIPDTTLDLPSPHGMGHSWYDAAASEYLFKVETWEWSTLNGDRPGYTAICESWHSFTKTSLWNWVNGKGFNQFQEEWMDDEGMKARKEIKDGLVEFDAKVRRFES